MEALGVLGVVEGDNSEVVRGCGQREGVNEACATSLCKERHERIWEDTSSSMGDLALPYPKVRGI